MSVKSFKFVSPGIFINEVDNSQLPRLPEEVGPVIIGRAERGPAMVPVKIDSFSEFVETFGNPIAGGEGDDVWRQGNRLGPTYAAFAAQAYLKSASPITFVRLLGEANPDASSEGVAGWKANHAYGLFVGDDTVSTTDRYLAAVIYSDKNDLGLNTAGNQGETGITNGVIKLADSTGTEGVGAVATLTFDNPVADKFATATLTIDTPLDATDNGSPLFILKDGSTPNLAIQTDFAAVADVFTPGFGADDTLTIALSSDATADGQAAKILTAISNVFVDHGHTLNMSLERIGAAITFTATVTNTFGAVDSFVQNFSSNTSVSGFVDGGAVTTSTFLLKTPGAADLTISLDTTTTLSGLVGSTLTVGISGKATVAEQAAELVETINNDAPATTTVTASSNLGVVTLVQEVPAALTVITDFVSGLDAAFLSAVLTTDGEDASTTPFIKSFNFDENSKLYIRNVLNTNPTLTNGAITADDAKENYWLAHTFDSYVSEKLTQGDGAVPDFPSSIDWARLVKLDSFSITNATFNNMELSAQAPATPMVVSQYLGDPTQFEPTAPAVQDLFKIHALYAGEWEQKNFKISITDVAAPRNSFTKYGTFSVVVRDAKDTDAAPVIYERFSNCDLDPTSSNYIGVKIGDMKQVWSNTELRYIEEGQYLNQSRFIRVEVVDVVESGAANPELLPFGFMVPKTVADKGDGGKTYMFPQLSLRANSRGTKISSPSQASFGVTSESSSERFDPSYADAVRRLIKSDTGLTKHTKFFSLDLLKSLGSIDAEYDEASMTDLTSFNAVSGDYSTVLSNGFDSFTMPFVGGFDGLDITEIEPFNDTITASATAVNNYAFNSMKKAIDTVSDPEVVECNLMAVPGVASPGITSHLISTCENRADALAVIDIENDYTPRGWDKRSESDRLPQVNLAVSTLRDRRINSSYGCAYFPWVQVRDSLSNKLVWMPPSVAALGTMASSAAKSELWFAPAGFTRGGLSNGAAGLPVVQTRYRLTSKHRDSLYEANINPIAQFPAEGIVIFGQKTLQVTPSALDRINVRRLMVYVKKEISRMAATLLFDQNVDTTWNRFLSKAEPFLASVKSRFGLTEYRVILDETTTTPELVDRNIVYAKVFLKPARAIEFIAIDFVITNTGASFDD